MNYRPFAGLILLGLVLLIGSRFGATQRLSSFLSWPVQPVLASEATTTRKTVTFFNVITSIRDLARENARLQARTTELEAELTQLKEVKHENDILRQELNFTKETEDTHIPAQLIGRTPAGVIKDIVLNRGERDGVKVGQPVVAQGYLVGVVNQVEERQSKAALLTHPRSVVPVLLQDTRSTGLLRGGISGLTVSDILIDSEVKSGETIVTSGLGGALPAGIPIGRILSVSSRKGDITKRATVAALLDITKLEMVFIRKAQ